MLPWPLIKWTSCQCRYDGFSHTASFNLTALDPIQQRESLPKTQTNIAFATSMPGDTTSEPRKRMACRHKHTQLGSCSTHKAMCYVLPAHSHLRTLTITLSTHIH